MANALNLSGTGYVNVGSPTALDNLTAFTLLVLYRGGTVGGFRGLADKRGGSGTSGWRLAVNGTPDGWIFGADFSTTDTQYSNTGLLSSSSTWYWVACAVDYSASAGNRVAFRRGQFGTSLTTVTTFADAEPVGSVVADGANDLLIGRHAADATNWGEAIAFAGILAGQLSLSATQAVVDSMATASWLTAVRLGWDGAATAPDFTGTASPSVVGTTSLVTDAPDYWTGGGGASPTGRVTISFHATNP